MDLTPHIDQLCSRFLDAATAGGPEMRTAAQQLVAPLDTAARLALLEALSAAADEITTELAPGSVELRLRGGDPEFAVHVPDVSSAEPAPAEPAPAADDEGAMVRINLRMSERVKADIEQAAARERLSVNAWLVRAATTSLALADAPRTSARADRHGNSFSGWVQ